MTYAALRSGSRFYIDRPPTANRAAHEAWDLLAPLASLRLLDGLWIGMKADGSTVDVEASLVLRRVREPEDYAP